MDVRKEEGRAFDEAVSSLAPSLCADLVQIAQGQKASVQEVRLRAGQPIALTILGRQRFLSGDGALTDIPTPRCRIVTRRELEECVGALCGHSIHTHQHELKDGYLSLRGGHRAGIAATAVYDENRKLKSVRDISSIVLRIARRYEGCAKGLCRSLFLDGVKGTLIAGSPGSGKTTLLRDIASQLSSGACARRYRVTVVDERGELTQLSESGFCDQNFDVMKGFYKGDGILSAVRSLGPEVILCDEVGDADDIAAVKWALNCGVAVISSIHASTPREVLGRPAGRALIESGAFSQVVFLKGADMPALVREVVRTDELISQIRGGPTDDRERFSGRDVLCL